MLNENTRLKTQLAGEMVTEDQYVLAELTFTIYKIWCVIKEMTSIELLLFK